jgi:hypothetical protein
VKWFARFPAGRPAATPTRFVRLHLEALEDLNAPNIFGFTAGLLADLAYVPVFVAVGHFFARTPVGDNIEILSVSDDPAPPLATDAAAVDAPIPAESITFPPAVTPDETAAGSQRQADTDETLSGIVDRAETAAPTTRTSAGDRQRLHGPVNNARL